MKNIKVIAFDADDTLWINEPHFQETERKFCNLLIGYLPHESITKELFKTEMENLPLYGYGVKAFILSMLETLVRIASKSADLNLVQKVIQIGRELLEMPVEIIDGVKNVLNQLSGKYQLIVATKGDLLEQERKLLESGLEKYFNHTEIMSNKKAEDYSKLLKNINCKAENFLMVGNSLKSDIIPVLDLGGYAIHVPFHTTWAHEQIDVEIKNTKFKEAKNIAEVLEILE